MSLYENLIAYNLGRQAGGSSDATVAEYMMPQGIVGYGAEGRLVGSMPIMPHLGVEYMSVTKLSHIVYGNGVYVGYNDRTLYRSEDGANWSYAKAVGRDIEGLAFGHGKFIALVYNTTTAYYSEDGLTWSEMTMPLSAYNWFGFGVYNDRFIALNYRSGIMSLDGINWTTFTIPESLPDQWTNQSLTTDGTYYYLAPNMSKNYNLTREIHISTDLENWTTVRTPAYGLWHSIVYGNGAVVAFNSASEVVVSTDKGNTWSMITLAGRSTRMYFAGGKFIATVENKDTCYYSVDGLNWNTTVLPFSAYIINIAYDGKKYIAYSPNITNIAFSDDGIVWSASAPTEYELLANKLVVTAEGCDAKTILVLDDQIKFAGGGGGDDELKASLIGVIEKTVTEFTVPEGTTKIGYYAFCNCSNLASISLPNSLTRIESYAFQYCPKLALTSLPNSVTYIGSNTFSGCTNLALTSLPNSLTRIEIYAFEKCINLVITSIPNGVNEIGSYAFSNCTGLQSLTFEGKVKTINHSAFHYCTNLTTINVPWAEGEVSGAPWSATNATINYNYTGE